MKKNSKVLFSKIYNYKKGIKAFTLIEISIIVLITAILSFLALSFVSFNSDTFYLKNFTYKLVSNINLLKDFSLSRKVIGSNRDFKVCGYGLEFASTSEHTKYYGYVFPTTSEKSCDELASTTPTLFVPTSPLYYLYTNGSIATTTNNFFQIKDEFKKIAPSFFKISTSSLDCSSDLFEIYANLALVFYNPYGEILLLGKRNSGSNWDNILNSTWNNIYFCIKYKNDLLRFKINRSGQLHRL